MCSGYRLENRTGTPNLPCYSRLLTVKRVLRGPDGQELQLAERERRSTPPFGGVFVARSRVMDADDVQRAIWRMAHEIIEHNHGLDDVVLVGLQTGGIAITRRLADALEQIEAVQVPTGTLDVAFHRDDYGLRPVLPEAVTSIPFDLTGAIVVL